MKHLKLTFEDIMQSNILYYDKASEAACFDICNYLSIDNMPDIDGEHFYELHNGQFQKEVIADQHKVSSNISIFSQENLEKFKVNRHNVLFACEELAIRGIVHLSDYNRDVVLQYIQDDVLAFERKLRQLILLHNYQNHDIRAFFEYRGFVKRFLELSKHLHFIINSCVYFLFLKIYAIIYLSILVGRQLIDTNIQSNKLIQSTCW